MPGWRRGGSAIDVVHLAPTAFGRAGLFGGGERYPLELARAVARVDGVSCELVTFGATAGRFADPVEPRLRTRIVTPRAHWRGHPAHPLSMAVLHGSVGADIVHAHQLHSTPTRAVGLLRTMVRRPAVVTDHGLAGSDWGGLLPHLFERLLAVSRFSAAQLRFPAQRTRVIHGGADTRRFAPAMDADRDGVLFVGRLTPHKGVDRLLRALPAGAALTIAGTAGHDRHPPESEYPALLQRLAAGRAVRFSSVVDDESLADAYRRAAVVAVPSVDLTCYGRPVPVSELLGLTTLEAMASATPVVASRLGGLAELVVDGETGYLVDGGDVDALHDRLAELLADRRTARRLGDNARALVQERFTWEHCAMRCVDAYREVLAGA